MINYKDNERTVNFLRNFKPISKIMVILLLLLITSGCSFNTNVSTGNIDEDKKTAMVEIQLLHTRMNNEQYTEIYEQGSSYLQQNQDKKTTITTFTETRKELGKFTKVKDSRINALINKAPVEFRVACVSEFEKASVTEMFIFVKEGSKVKLVTYNISKDVVNLDEVKNSQ